jgi:hypothetical protein
MLAGDDHHAVHSLAALLDLPTWSSSLGILQRTSIWRHVLLSVNMRRAARSCVECGRVVTLAGVAFADADVSPLGLHGQLTLTVQLSVRSKSDATATISPAHLLTPLALILYGHTTFLECSRSLVAASSEREETNESR